MNYVECPDVYERKEGEKSLFLAGGISGCRVWQKDMADLLKEEDLVVINPRRRHFDINDPQMEYDQIKWEYEHLGKSDSVSFWFPKETLCPITLYELGKIVMSDKPLFVGCDPQYERRRDVEIQLGLSRPEVKIVYSLNELAKQIVGWEE
jgi:hypothetical protein